MVNSPPRGLPYLVPRVERLLGSWEPGQPGLIIAQAPAGFGKTAVMTELYDLYKERQFLSVWAEYYPGDDGTHTFLRRLHDSLDWHDIEFSAGITEDSTKNSFSLLLQKLWEVQRPTALLLDQFEHINSLDLCKWLVRLIDEGPQDLAIAIATRAPLHPPLARKRSYGQSIELKADKLCFNVDEVKQILPKWFGANSLSRLFSFTNGWPAAIGAIGKDSASISEGSFQEEILLNQTSIFFQYLEYEVFEQLTPSQQQYLLDLSYLDEFSDEMSNYVRESNNDRTLREELGILDGLILQCNNEKRRYHLNRLFRQFLSEKALAYNSTPKQLLFERATAWHANNSELLPALRYACASKNYEWAATLMEQLDPLRTIPRLGTRELDEALTFFPKNIIEQYPLLSLMQSLCSMKAGNIKEGKLTFYRVHDLLVSAHQNNKNTESYALKRVIVYVYLYLGFYCDYLTKDGYIQQAQWLLEHEGSDRESVVLAMLALSAAYQQLGQPHLASEYIDTLSTDYGEHEFVEGVSFLHMYRGLSEISMNNLSEANRHYKDAQKKAMLSPASKNNLEAISKVFQAEVHYKRNEITEAQRLITEALSQTESKEAWFDAYFVAYSILSYSSYRQNGLRGAFSVLSRADQIMKAHGVDSMFLSLEVLRAHFLIQNGDISAANLKVQQLGLHFTVQQHDFLQHPWRERDLILGVLARMATLSGDYCEAENYVDSIEKDAEENGRFSGLLLVCLLRSVNHAAQGDDTAAFIFLTSALNLSMQESIISVFIDEGLPVNKLLTQYLKQDETVYKRAQYNFAVEIVNAFRSDSRPSGTTGVLTQKQLYVLDQLNRGLTNKEIARNLGLTEDGVKFHLKRIYRRLVVTSRKEALSVAYKLSLLR